MLLLWVASDYMAGVLLLVGFCGCDGLYSGLVGFVVVDLM